MDKKLIITSLPLRMPANNLTQRYRACALYEDGRLAEVSLQPDGMESILNNIYIARVKNVTPNLNAAFVEISKGHLCFLPLEHLGSHPPLFTKKISNKPIAAGDELAVQVSKEAMKSKEAVVTANLSFPGEYFVLTSTDYKIGISSKIPGNDRKRLHQLAKGLKGDDSHYGVIVRTNALQADEPTLRAEFLRLKEEYEALASCAPSRTAYSCLRKEQPFYLKVLMDMDKSVPFQTVTDDPHIFGELQPFITDTMRLRLYEDKMLPLWRLYHLSGSLEAALKPRVWLKSGANIVIQPTEALTVIDVNSGKNVSKKDKQQYHYKVNLEAAKEIARQLRLRNLSGIIIIDFIDLDDEGLNDSLLSGLRSYLKGDPVKCRLAGMTNLGLVELTRKKVKKPLSEQLIAIPAKKS